MSTRFIYIGKLNVVLSSKHNVQALKTKDCTRSQFTRAKEQVPRMLNKMLSIANKILESNGPKVDHCRMPDAIFKEEKI